MHHSPHSAPPRSFPQVVLKLKETYQDWLVLHRDFPKVERLGIGNKIDRTFLECLELTFCLSYLSPEHKVPMLNKAITRFDVLKFFVQLAWETKLIKTNHHTKLTLQLEEIGRQLGGWKKGLQTKNSPTLSRGERQ